ncbi:ribonuclease P protein component [Psychroflexus sediminis]|uniref:Ribonuclease P protein component n=1 Tax=Psychroflexus sediminis TaxID=470826 RepID=A0A1G7YEL6_9FLAO|nr:ribonuclease P protein component [Psychroflexus sediminis]SDG94767.1 ribonuclease P protein component [Psychroflexus sediminis]
MNLKSFTYPEEEKLKSKKLIKKVFEEGKTIKSFPILIRYTEHEENRHKVGVSVPKRNFKNAVDRNQIKRQLREAYRLNQHELTDFGSKFAVMITYIGKKKVASVKIHETLKSLLKELT